LQSGLAADLLEERLTAHALSSGNLRQQEPRVAVRLYVQAVGADLDFKRV
jgi:hypothetical protein